MLASEFKNTNETLKKIFELDELVHNVFANSTCKELDSLSMFKFIKGKHPINNTDDSIYFNTTEDVKIELASTPKMIASNNRKLTIAQANNSTIDKSVYLKKMGQ